MAFPAGTYCAMDGADENACQQRGAHLVSSEQGRQKSAFCKALMPRCVAALLYRQSETDLAGTSRKTAGRNGANKNMDEFDKYAAGKMPNRFALILMGAGIVRKHKVAFSLNAMYRAMQRG